MSSTVSLIEELRPSMLALISYEAAKSEGGRRLSAYSAWKWWGRRFSILARALLASLVLRPGEEHILQGVLADSPEALETVSARAAGRLVVDPFAGGGTILAEAVKLGYNAYGVDIDPAAVAVAQATLETLCGNNCSKLLSCLRSSLIAAWQRTRQLWEPEPGVVVVHIFLARCSTEEGFCEAPAWLTTLRRNRLGPQRILVVDPSSKQGLRIIEGPSISHYRPEYPVVKLPPELPLEARGLAGYAVELYNTTTRRRWFEPLYTPTAAPLRRWLEETGKKARRLAGEKCTPIPRLRESLRLLRSGVECWEEIYTPRQLVSLQAFVEEARLHGCGFEAKLVAGSVTRTASLLAFYYQPYSKVNPGLVVKSYWMPRYPVELNPLAHTLNRQRLRTLGRGTIASHITMIARACRAAAACKGEYRVTEGRAEDPHSIPQETYAVVTDPPYPGMQSYADLSLPYHYWLTSSLPEHKYTRIRGKAYVKLLSSFAEAATNRLPRGAYLVLILGAPSNELQTLAQAIAAIVAKGFGLRRIYWLTGEASGILGRSSNRGVYVTVMQYGVDSREDALNPLGWVEEIVSMIPEDMLERLALNPQKENRDAERLARLVSEMLES